MAAIVAFALGQAAAAYERAAENPAAAVVACVAVAVVAWLTCQRPTRHLTTAVANDADETTVRVATTAAAGAAAIGALKRGRKPAAAYPPPYPNGWYQLCYSHELKPGETRHVQACGLHIALFRTAKADGAHVRALNAFCPHLGANLGVGSKVIGNGVQCPFHAWEFDGSTGKCTNIPYSAACQKSKARAVGGVTLTYEDGGAAASASGAEGKGKGKGKGNGNGNGGGKGKEAASSATTDGIPAAAHTTAYTVEERNCMVLLWFDAEGRPPTWRPEPLTTIDRASGGSYVYHGMCDHRVNAHIQELPENGADTNHLGVLHEPFVVELLQPYIVHTWDMTYTCNASSSPKPHVATGEVDQSWAVQMPSWVPRVGGKRVTVPFTRLHVNVLQEGPGIVSLYFDTPMGRCVVFETVTPIAPLLQRTTHAVYGEWKMPRVVAKGVLNGVITQYERDVMIFNAKTFQSRPVLVKEDGAIMEFRRWFKQFYSEHSADAAKPNAALDW